jgi:hypothetical protein
LREGKPMKLILTEIPSDYQDSSSKSFPPVKYLQDDQPFDISRLSTSSPYFWYPPIQQSLVKF